MRKAEKSGNNQPRAKDGKWTGKVTPQPDLPAVDAVALSQQISAVQSHVVGVDEWPENGASVLVETAKRLQQDSVPGYAAAAEAAAGLPSALSMSERVQYLVGQGIPAQAAVAASVKL